MPYKKTPMKKASAARSSGRESARYTPKKGAPQSKNNRSAGGDPERLLHQLMPYILALVALFLFICYFISDSTGFFGILLKNAMFGLFSFAAWAVPFALVYADVFWKRGLASGSGGHKLIFSLLCITFLAVLGQAFASSGEGAIAETYNIVTLFKNGCANVGGGMIGGLVGNLLLRGFGFAGTLILSVALILLFGLFLFGLTPQMIAVYIKSAIGNWRSGVAERIDDAGHEREERINEYETRSARKPAPARVVRPSENTRSRRRVNDALDDEEDTGFFDAAASVESDAAANGTAEAEPIVDPAVFDEIRESEARKNAKTDDEPPFDMDGAVVVDSDEPSFDEYFDANGKSGSGRIEKIKPMPPTGMQELEAIETGEIDLSKIFTEPDDVTGETPIPGMPEDGEIVTSAEIDLMVEKSRLAASENAVTLGEDDEEADEAEASTYASVSKGTVKAEQMKIDYAFPPISLLKVDTSSHNSDMSAEIQHTATQLF